MYTHAPPWHHLACKTMLHIQKYSVKKDGTDNSIEKTII